MPRCLRPNGPYPPAPVDVGDALFVPWPKIGSLHKLAHDFHRRREQLSATYMATVKMDGTNCGIVIWPDGTLDFQSRRRLIYAEPKTADNAGFCRHMQEHRAAFAALARPDVAVLLYGEYCGPKVANGRTAVAMIDERALLVFGVATLSLPPDFDRDDPEALAQFRAEPGRHCHLELDARATLAAWAERPPFVHAVTFIGDDGGGGGTPTTFTFHLHPDRTPEQQAEHERELERANALVDAVSQRDPYVLREFGVEGPGEGVVFVPVRVVGPEYNSDGGRTCTAMPMWRYGRLAIKGVAQAFREDMWHKKPVWHAGADGKPAAKEPTPAEKLAPLVCTEARLDKIRSKMALDAGLAADALLPIQRIRDFVVLVQADVLDECVATMNDANVSARDLNRTVGHVAMAWYKRHLAGVGPEDSGEATGTTLA